MVKNRLLTNDEAKSARLAYAAGEATATELSEMHGMRKESMYKMLRGETYKGAGGPMVRRHTYSPRKHAKRKPATNAAQPERRGRNRKLANVQAKDIRQSYSTGKFSIRDLSRKHGVSEPLIHNIVYGKSYIDAGGPIAKPKPYRRKAKAKAAPKPIEKPIAKAETPDPVKAELRDARKKIVALTGKMIEMDAAAIALAAERKRHRRDEVAAGILAVVLAVFGGWLIYLGWR